MNHLGGRRARTRGARAAPQHPHAVTQKSPNPSGKTAPRSPRSACQVALSERGSVTPLPSADKFRFRNRRTPGRKRAPRGVPNKPARLPPRVETPLPGLPDPKPRGRKHAAEGHQAQRAPRHTGVDFDAQDRIRQRADVATAPAVAKAASGSDVSVAALPSERRGMCSLDQRLHRLVARFSSRAALRARAGALPPSSRGSPSPGPRLQRRSPRRSFRR